MKIELYQGFSTLSLNKIRETEKEMNVKFPNEYVEFLKAQNGGLPKKEIFTFPDKSNMSNINVFYPINEGKGNLVKKNRIFHERIPNDFITIGCDSSGNQLLIGVTGKEVNKIYFWYHDIDPNDESPLCFLANNLKSFLEMLK